MICLLFTASFLLNPEDVKMARLLLFRAIAKLLGPVGLGATAFYLGTQNSHVMEKAEHNLLRSHMEYAADAHRGSLGIEEVENNNGKLEKKLKNLDTGDFIYSIKADCLPDTYFVFNGLAGRAKSSGPKELRQIREYTGRLESLIEDRLYSGVPISKDSVNPLKLKVHVRENIEGELETVLNYGERSLVLKKQDFDYLARSAKPLAQQAGFKTVPTPDVATQASGSVPKDESGGSTFLYLGIVGLLAVAAIAYRKARKEYPV